VAAERWPRDGVPPNPVGWLTVTARNRAIDRVRRERNLAEKLHLLEVPEVTMDEHQDAPIEDERLQLIFTCCHPALSVEAQVALTLRTLGGLTTEEIARAFLTSEETMKRRLSRARAKIKLSGIPFLVPDTAELPDRLDAVLAVVYLIFTEAWGPGREQLAGEAIRLGRLLAEVMPDEPEVHGLLGLMLISEARRAARFADGAVVLLADQDRELWDHEAIAAGRVAAESAIALRGRGAYVLQAAIASLESEREIDWEEVVLLYDQLVALTYSPVMELSRAVAVAETGSPERALAIVDGLALDGYRYLHSTRAELLRRLGLVDEARAAYGRALALTTSEPERRFLEQRRSEI
jgi:RNA polymerase sigma-70 factor (ECF subfamily)